MNEQQLEQLNTLLLQGISILETLSLSYDKELEALSGADLSALSDIAQVKSKQLDQFHQFTLERIALLQGFGLDSSQGDYQLPETDLQTTAGKTISKTTARLKELLTELQEKNRLNEQTIQRNQQNVSQLLDIVRGQRPQDQLYNQKGSSGLYKAQSRLGKA